MTNADSSSPGANDFEQDIIASLRANRIAPKLLYVTPRQAELWRQVFLKHAPIHGNPDFARLYGEAFSRAADESPRGEVHLVGLGCGTGMKEEALAAVLQERGRTVRFSALDISGDLAGEAMQRLVKLGAADAGMRVGDLADAAGVVSCLEKMRQGARMLFTFFGMVPNLPPSVVTELFRSILQPGDRLLVSAHLAPVGEGVDLPAAMGHVLPQYDNPETLAWLGAALEQWDLTGRLDAPRMKIGEIEGVPAFVATARWKSTVAFDELGRRFTPKAEQPFELFHSLRYTPELFEQRLREAGFAVERLAMTKCREEAIWSLYL